jgi:hypothetical protein
MEWAVDGSINNVCEVALGGKNAGWRKGRKKRKSIIGWGGGGALINFRGKRR